VSSTLVPDPDLPGKLSGLGDNSEGPVTLIWKSLGRNVPPSSLTTLFMTLRVEDSSLFVIIQVLVCPSGIPELLSQSDE
jgi:hypothetical protein